NRPPNVTNLPTARNSRMTIGPVRELAAAMRTQWPARRHRPLWSKPLCQRYVPTDVHVRPGHGGSG
ncbi:uncharacterized protein METZ01_LOCUS188499, partial [marine metagenome]